MKYILAIFCLIGVVMAIDPYTDQGTDTVLYNRTNKNVRPNGANQIFNNLGATNLTIESNIVVGETVTIGRTNDPTAGAMDLGTTNFVLIVRLTINTNGDFVMSDGTNTMMVLKKSSGTDGSTNKFLAADGHYYNINDSLWTNILGTITGNSTAADGGTGFSMITSNTFTSGNVVIAKNKTATILQVNYQGDTTIGDGSGATKFTANGADGSASLESAGRMKLLPLSSLKTDLNPDAFDGSTPYIYDTSITHTSGNLLELSNNGVMAVEVDFAGVLYLKDGTMKAVTFGASDSGGTGFKLLRVAN